MRAACLVALLVGCLLPAVSARGVEAKASRIIIPDLAMEEASARDVLEFIQEYAKQHDPEGQGISILCRLSPAGRQLFEKKSITLRLNNVPFTEVVRYVHLMTGLNSRYDQHALMVFDGGAAAQPMETRVYRLGAGIVDSPRTRARPEPIDRNRTTP